MSAQLISLLCLALPSAHCPLCSTNFTEIPRSFPEQLVMVNWWPIWSMCNPFWALWFDVKSHELTADPEGKNSCRNQGPFSVVLVSSCSIGFCPFSYSPSPGLLVASTSFSLLNSGTRFLKSLSFHPPFPLFFPHCLSYFLSSSFHFLPLHLPSCFPLLLLSSLFCPHSLSLSLTHQMPD